MRYTIGVIVKYWNEEVLLPYFLSALNKIHADKVYLCNDGSTDSSEEICKEYTKKNRWTELISFEPPRAEYFKETWPESQKINQVLQKAYSTGCDWVICLDIDEVLSLPMIKYINEVITLTPPNYGVYFPIMDLIGSIKTHILVNQETQFQHYPCPHLKVFGKQSGYQRTVNQLKLDQGVEGGSRYIMTQEPYFHLKYLFKNRRCTRGVPMSEQVPNHIPEKVITRETNLKIVPIELIEFLENFKEPAIPW
jgi:glycosyltransferase involved in cell wall biosynthesis